MKYMCLEDIVLFDNIIAYKYDIVTLNQVLSSGQISVCLDEDFLEKNKSLFRPIENLNIKTKEFNSENEEIVKDWILELKITTSRKKLRQIEQFLNQEVVKFI
jgi:hypothetical protein